MTTGIITGKLGGIPLLVQPHNEDSGGKKPPRDAVDKALQEGKDAVDKQEARETAQTEKVKAKTKEMLKKDWPTTDGPSGTIEACFVPYHSVDSHDGSLRRRKPSL